MRHKVCRTHCDNDELPDIDMDNIKTCLLTELTEKKVKGKIFIGQGIKNLFIYEFIVQVHV